MIKHYSLSEEWGMIGNMSCSRPSNSDPRYRPSPTSTGGWPTVARRAEEPPTADRRRRQLAEHPGCQWQARAVRCVTQAVDVVVSREDVLRSTCEGHVGAWLRTGARRLA